MNRTLLGCLMLAALGGCSEPAREAGPEAIPVAADNASSVPSNPTAAGEGASVEKKFQGITLTVPAGWTEKPAASEFIQAEFQLPGADGPARLTMSSTGGGMEANLERWQGQILSGPNDPSPQRDVVTVDGQEAVIVEFTGQFQDQFSGGGLKSDWTLLGAAIPTGPAHFFLKMTGPRTTVAEHRDAFRQMVQSARLDQ